MAFSKIAPRRLKKCATCGELKPTATDYAHAPARKDGLFESCRACKAAYDARFQAGKKALKKASA